MDQKQGRLIVNKIRLMIETIHNQGHSNRGPTIWQVSDELESLLVGKKEGKEQNEKD